jgi:hypothetical protein
MPGLTQFSAERPAARIRARVAERRLLEARFLLRQFSNEIDARERRALDQEIGNVLAEVERLRHLARAAMTAGRREEAARLYRDIEQLAVDVPGVAEEQRALAGAEAIFARIVSRSEAAVPVLTDLPAAVEVENTGSVPGPETVRPTTSPIGTSGRNPVSAGASDTWRQMGHRGRAYGQKMRTALNTLNASISRPLQVSTWFRMGRWRPSFRVRLMAGCCAGLVVVFLVLWQAGTKEEPPSPPSPPSPEHHILIRPLVAETPATPQQPTSETVSPDTTGPHSIEEQPPAVAGPGGQPDEPPTASLEKPPPDEQPAAPASQLSASPQSTTLKLGVLQIESSGKSDR